MQLNLKKTLAIVAASLMAPLFALAQNISVSGTVTDQSGEAIIGAAVMVVGDSTNGAVTDIDGNYSIRVASTATLEVSSIGYKTQLIPVQGRTQINVVLEEDAEQL